MAPQTTVLISGGNAGIGYEIVKKIALTHPDTHHVWMGTRDLARGEEALQKLGSPSNVTLIPLDITHDASIDQAVATIQSTHGRLDILIHNAGTAGRDIGVDTSSGALPETLSLREVYEHVYRVNTVSAAVLTDKMTPSLEQSSLPKVIFVSSILGSTTLLANGGILRPLPWYSLSKAAMNHLCVWYSRMYPRWKVNASCPGHVATGLNTIERTDSTDPANGAVNVYQLVMEGADGCTGTFSNRETQLSW
ncbi:hypothetical protein HFD88_004200 [Aspergillus terreus]|nr:hypothetical protein HFD88_004200 [Aspergillus terreus]